jgi:2-keto-4-pentenoate hydratase
MNLSKYEKLAASLKEAEKTCNAIEAISKNNPELEIKDAYKIQLINIEKEIADGKKISGKKIGLTSLAMQKFAGVDQPDFGHLLNSMEVKNNTIDRSTMLQPRVEGEIAFVLKEDVKGPNATIESVIEATEYVAAAIEIVDSRIENWKIKIVDTVADNASSGMYVISNKKVDPRTVDLTKIAMDLYKGDKKINSGVGSDVLDNPAFCVAWLANTLWQYGVELKKGEVVLSGALTAMQAAEAGDEYTAKFTELGDVSVKFI